MSDTGVQASDYAVPGGILGLKGPVEKPAPGTLPLRGDLAHVALAGTHLAAHYVIPHVGAIGDADIELHLVPRDDSDATETLTAGTAIEVLDVAGDWIWICVGPAGPSGYCKANCLAD
ncbi:hypothetical protein [Erythrobacter crassostreae]|uniref:Bacterial dipeptidyl-peptidase SH3 domain-containing protein n=1 Tax=Erythrobacter crassostreae TaxID=2828328 RepID=A0A9X1F4Q5_9SPHN|nr:hypothetical protein [Erythrobacter crassostrea]MBV7259293.1 hypothetical protein [Erythrobacter crassostrea]